MINNLINIKESELDRHIYRIYPLKRFLQLLENKENVLVKTSLWEDPFENFILNSTGKLPSGELFTVDSRNRYFGQCWSLKRESDAMWRIYSQHIKDTTTNKLLIDNIGIKVKSTVRKVFEPLFNVQSNHTNPLNGELYNLSSFVGKVEYKKRVELIDLLTNATDYLFDQSGKGQASTLMLKRLAFTHEREVRVVYHNEKCLDTDKIYSYPIVPNFCFEELVVDPRIPKADYLKIKERITIAGYSNSIVQSSLYKIENFVFPARLP